MHEAIFQELIKTFVTIAYPLPLLLWALAHLKTLIMIDNINKVLDPEIITVHNLTFVGAHEKLFPNILFLFGYAYIYFIFYV